MQPDTPPRVRFRELAFDERVELATYATRHEYVHADLVQGSMMLFPVLLALGQNEHEKWWMMHLDGESEEPVGFAINAADPELKQLCLVHMFVKPEFRKRGVATLIVQQAQDMVRDIPGQFDHVHLDCRPEAVPFYAARGFVDNGLNHANFHYMTWRP